MIKIIEHRTSRISDAKLIELFSLGNLYMSDFVDSDTEPTAVPLTLMLDPKSGLVQLKHTAPFDSMYRNYWYRSGMNRTMTKELEGIAQKSLSLVKCTRDDVVLDIGANDGTLLNFYEDKVYKVGFDPAVNMEQYSRKCADKIVVDYFTANNYWQVMTRKAKIITTIAMFYDLEDPHKFVEDIVSVLDDDGLWIVQMSYMPLMLKQMAFDNVVHEHLEYYSLSSFQYLIEQHGLKVVDVELNDINGGSFRIYVRKQVSNDDKFATAPYRDVAWFRVESLLEGEKSLELLNPDTYSDWFEKIQELRKQTVEFIVREESKGRTVWGYGASTKGNTLLQWYGLDNTCITAIAERNPDKYGKFTVGTNIPIVSEDEMRKAKPDYLLMLPWHFITEFKNREMDYLNAGGKFIVPLPQFKVVGS
jgi:hypothetical protein